MKATKLVNCLSLQIELVPNASVFMRLCDARREAEVPEGHRPVRLIKYQIHVHSILFWCTQFNIVNEITDLKPMGLFR